MGFLEVPENKRNALEARVRRHIAENGPMTDSGLYDYVVNVIESWDIPHQERYAVRLDAAPNDQGRLRHEFVHVAPEESPSLVCISALPGGYDELVEGARLMLGLRDLVAMVRDDLASVDEIAQRLEILKEREKSFLYVVPPGKPLKRVSFTARNELVVQLGDYPKDFDPLANYRTYYEGVPRGRLARVNNALYRLLLTRGLLGHVPVIQHHRNFESDPFAYYKEHYDGKKRGWLARNEPGLYEALKRTGQLKEVPVMSTEVRSRLMKQIIREKSPL